MTIYVVHFSTFAFNRIVGVINGKCAHRESWSGKTKHYQIGICYISAKHTTLGIRAKTGWLVFVALRIIIVFPSRVIELRGHLFLL
jgi:hypothetical protein